MTPFSYKNGILCAENVPLPLIAETAETPFYCYSSSALEKNASEFADAVKKEGLDALICFAVKSNANPAVLRTFAAAGIGADIVSGGELELALAAGIPPEKIVFSGVGKTEKELEAALDAGIFQLNAESAEELETLNEIAIKKGKKAPVALRINPDVDAHTHAKISTGKKENKFGISWEIARPLYAEAAKMKGISPVGIDVHIGSQLTETAPFEEAFGKVADMLRTLRKDGINISRIDVGGGLGVVYRDDDAPPSFKEYAAAVKKYFGDAGCRIIFEPGRRLSAEAGILVSRVVRVKKTPAKTFLVVDAGMNDLVRPAMYDAYHAVAPVVENGGEKTLYDVVGPVCESSDVFAKNRLMQTMRAGDLVAFKAAGAYGSSMSSTYNMRPLAAEIMVKGDRFAVVRKRQSISDVTRACSLAPWQEEG